MHALAAEQLKEGEHINLSPWDIWDEMIVGTVDI
jgi:hypothetical protein